MQVGNSNMGPWRAKALNGEVAAHPAPTPTWLLLGC